MATAPRKPYPSDLTDAHWQRIAHFFTPPAQQPGPKAVVPRREILNAILYLLREGCRWRSLPHEFPTWRTVNDCFRRWQHSGLFQQVYEELHRAERVRPGRTPPPTAGALDSQSVTTGACAREDHGYDAGKKIKGRNRHLLVDTLGLPEALLVTGAEIQDRDGGQSLLTIAQQTCQCLCRIWADGGYAGKLVDWVKSQCGWVLEIVKRCDDMAGFVLLPHRWVVERTFGWFSHFRRLHRDHEAHAQTSETMLYLAMIHLLLRRQTVVEGTK